MTDEPTYYFVRGQGWVPDTRTFQWGCRVMRGHMVTLEFRQPQIGEGFWFLNDNDTPENILDAMEKECIEYSDDPSTGTTWDTWWESSYRKDGKTCVVKVEKL